MQIGDKLRKGLRLLGGMLIGEKLATEEQVAAALDEQKQRKGRGWPHKRLGEILVEMSVVSRGEVDRVLAEQAANRTSAPEPVIDAVIEAADEAPRAPRAEPVLEPPAPAPAAPAEWAFIASKNAHVFHAQGCKSVGRISSANAVHFASREEAEASGRRACAKCC